MGPITIITPEIARELLDEFDAGERPPFVFVAMGQQDWLTLGQYLERVLQAGEQNTTILDYYQSESLKEKDDG